MSWDPRDITFNMHVGIYIYIYVIEYVNMNSKQAYIYIYIYIYIQYRLKYHLAQYMQESCERLPALGYCRGLGIF